MIVIVGQTEIHQGIFIEMRPKLFNCLQTGNDLHPGEFQIDNEDKHQLSGLWWHLYEAISSELEYRAWNYARHLELLSLLSDSVFFVLVRTTRLE
jgi:hypothetical protein